MLEVNITTQSDIWKIRTETKKDSSLAELGAHTGRMA